MAKSTDSRGPGLAPGRYRMRAAGLLFLGFMSLGIHAQSVAAEPHSPEVGVERFLLAEMRERGIPGLQVAVVQQGRIVLLRAYGVASVEHSVPVTSESVFPINSITKGFTGVAAMQLVTEGKLDLDAPASHYLDDLPASWRAVTVKQLFSHTSGLPDIVDDELRLLVDGDEAASWDKVRTLPLQAPAGERFAYNHTNYVLLGRIIDKLAGEPFTRFVTERQLQVAGMPATGYHDARDVVPHAVGMYRYVKAADGSRQLNTRYELWHPALLTATGINTTAEDLARWAIALQEGRLLDGEAALNTLWTPARLNDGSTGGFSRFINGYAIGWPTVERAEHRAIISGGGGRAVLAIYPSDGLIVVILTNLVGASPVQFAEDVASFYIPGLERVGSRVDR